MSIKCLIVSNYAAEMHNMRPEAEMVIGLKQRGLDIEVMTPADSFYARRMASLGIPIHDHLPRRKISLESIRILRRVLTRGRHQIAYLFNNPAIANGLIASRGLPVKVVTYRGQEGNIKRYDPFAYLTHLHARVARIVCVADAVRDSLRPELADPSKAITIYKGHDINWYADVVAADRAEFGIPDDAFLIICVANNRPRKGVPVLIEAVGLLPADTRVHVLLIGRGMDSPEIDALVQASKHAARLHQFGHRTDVLQLAAAANASVLPTIRREGLPKTVIESMAVSVPPIVTRSGGSPELVADGDSGLVVPPGDAAALAAAINELAADPDRAQQMGRAARQRLIEHFNLQTSIDQHEALFRELAAAG
ncbi:MAG: glycosyltransferase [Gammaproteobacteria bacterium]|nr:glycosyltransferase [Gammaproteobacteria bacterium]